MKRCFRWLMKHEKGVFRVLSVAYVLIWIIPFRRFAWGLSVLAISICTILIVGVDRHWDDDPKP